MTPETFGLLDRTASEAFCRVLWGERQDDCAKHGADIPMPRVEVRVDEMAELLRSAADLRNANEGWKRAFCALHDALEKIAGPRNADLSYVELHHESQRWARDALHTEDA